MNYVIPPQKKPRGQALPIMCGIWEEKSIRENTAACGARKLMQPPEPQFVRLSPHNDQLRKSHTTAFTRVDTVIHSHVIKRKVADPSVSSPALCFSLLFEFPSRRADFSAAKAVS